MGLISFGTVESSILICTSVAVTTMVLYDYCERLRSFGAHERVLIGFSDHFPRRSDADVGKGVLFAYPTNSSLIV